MSFFKRILGIIASFGFVFILFTAVFVGINMIDKNTNMPISIIETSMYLSDDVEESIWHEENNTIYLMIMFKTPHSNEYYINYAYHYYDLYDKPVHLIVEDDLGAKIITINNKGESSII